MPAKIGPAKIAAFAAVFALLLLATLAMTGHFIRTKNVIYSHKKTLSDCEAKMAGMAEVISLQKKVEKEKTLVRGSIKETALLINNHTQWSNLLREIAKNMPASIIVTNLEATEKAVKKAAKKDEEKDSAKKTVNLPQISRAFRISVCGAPNASCYEDVKSFSQKLRNAKLVKYGLEDLKISQGLYSLNSQDVVSYNIGCVFKQNL